MVYTLSKKRNSDGELIKKPSLENLRNRTLNKELIKESLNNDLIS